MRRSSRLGNKVMNYSLLDDGDDNYEEEERVAPRISKPRATKPTTSNNITIKLKTQTSPAKPAGRGLLTPPKRSANTSNSLLYSIPRDDLLQIAKRIDDKLERWQAVAGLALAGCFGGADASTSFLKHFWEDEARKLGMGNALVGPFGTLAKLKEAAKAGGYQGDTTISSISREELLPVVPQTVPPVVVAHAREKLRSQKAAKDYAAWLAAHPKQKNQKLTMTRAKNEYHLNDADLVGIRYEASENPYYSSAAPMRLYGLSDIVRVSYQKYGGKDGFERAVETSSKRKQALKGSRAEAAQRKAAEQNARREELRAALQAKGLELRRDFDICDEYIEHGARRYTSEQVADVLHSRAVAAQRKESEQRERREELKAALEARGLELNADVGICKEYIEKGVRNRTLAEIVDVMQERAVAAQRKAAEQQVRREALKAAFEARGLELNADLGICKVYIKHGSGTLTGVVDSVHARENGPQCKAFQQQARRDELKAALAERGLELRMDSKLCSSYIERGGVQHSLVHIVNIMHEVNFYFKHTNYRQYQQQAYRENKGRYGADTAGISYEAKQKACNKLIETKGREYVLSMSDLPPTFRARLEREQPQQQQQQQQRQIVE